MQERLTFATLLSGVLILLAGAALGGVFLLEKNGNHALLGIGTSITTAMMVGVAVMTPGVALILRALGQGCGDLPKKEASPRFFTPVCAALFLLSTAAVLFVIYFSFGMTLNLGVPRTAISWDISEPMKDFFHEGEIIGSIGFFTDTGLRDVPMLIHGPGRNLLPAWIVSQLGGTDTMVAQMRFVTSAGNFLGMLLAATCATVATLVIVTRQRLVVLGRAEALCYSALGVLFAMTVVAWIGSFTNREVVFFLVTLVSILLVWAAGTQRVRLASGLAVLLGALAMASPLHTYLGSVQAVMVAGVAAVIALVLSRGRRLTLFIYGIFGALLAFVIIWALGGYWLIHDAVTATLYWSENAGPLWGRYAPRFVLVGALILMGVGALLGGFALAGKAVGMADGVLCGVLILLLTVLMVATMSYSNLSDRNHLGFGLFVSLPALAGVASLIFLSLTALRPGGALMLALAFALPASLSLFSKDGSGIIRSVALLETPDRDILPADFFTFMSRYDEALAAQDCLLVMSNDGALAYLPRLPLCGEIFNPIHLNPEGDLALARWLEQNPQQLVVDGVEGYGAVGGPPMRSRLPMTYAVIDRLYPDTERLGLWEIRLP